MDISELRDWLDKNEGKIPERPIWKRTLMDIVGCTTLENRWSDVYRFFLTENEVHGLKDLFIRSLESLIKSKEPFSLKNFIVLREEAAKDENTEGRIDLLLLGENKQALIIENKVHATLEGNNNPLNTYTNSIIERGFQHIKKVVLALNRNYNDESKIAKPAGYIYITHIDFVREVEKRLPLYLTNANPLYLPLLQDFIQNIKNVTYMSVTEEQRKFFFENYDSVNKIHTIYSSVVNEYKDAFKSEYFSKLGLKSDFKLIDDKGLLYMQYNGSHLYLTVILNYLWDKNEQRKANINGPFVRVVIEQRDKIGDSPNELIRKYCEENNKIHESINTKDKDGRWQHFAYTDIPIEASSTIVSPADLVDKLKTEITETSPLYELLKKIYSYLY